MDEARYLELAKRCLDTVLTAFDEVDIEDADVEPAGDVIKIRFGDGGTCVLNTQRPARQMWLAADAHAWHFDWNDAAGEWRDHKTDSELHATIRSIARSHGVEL